MTTNLQEVRLDDGAMVNGRVLRLAVKTGSVDLPQFHFANS